MNCIDTYFRMISEIKQFGDERNAFSELDHQIQYKVGIKECANLLKEDCCKNQNVQKKIQSIYRCIN